MSDWRPIKTAPKDGSSILIGVPARGEWPGVTMESRWVNSGQRWWDWFGSDKPTHWQPMPEPPQYRDDLSKAGA